MKIDWKAVAEIAIGVAAGMLLSAGINWTIDKAKDALAK